MPTWGTGLLPSVPLLLASFSEVVPRLSLGLGRTEPAPDQPFSKLEGALNSQYPRAQAQVGNKPEL